MTQICQFIFSGPFVKTDQHSTTRCSHKRHYGSITSQSRFGDKCALFPLHSLVELARPDTLYIASQPHQIFLAAEHRRKPVPVAQEPTKFTVLASRVAVQEVHLSDCLLCLNHSGGRAPNVLWMTSRESGNAREREGCNLLTHSAETTQGE